MISVLEHVEGQEEAVAEIARVLRSGGLAGISVDTLDHPAWASYRPEHAEKSHVHRYLSGEELTELAERHGLRRRWGRYIYGNRVSRELLKVRLRPTFLAHWPLAPLVRLSGALDSRDSGFMYRAVFERA